MRKLRYIAEYLFLQAAVAIFGILPYWGALGVAWFLAMLAHRVFRYRTRTARERIRTVFGSELSPAQARRVAWLSWRNFIFGAVDLARIRKITHPWISRHIENTEPFVRAIEKFRRDGRGVILTSPHMGSWELAGIVLQRLGAPIFFTAAPQKNPFADQLVSRLRGGTGVEIIPRGSAMMQTVSERLKRGEWMAVLPDVRAPKEGVRVKFLGREANVHKGMAIFARRTGTPIVVGIAFRCGWTRHIFRLARIITPDPSLPAEEDVRRMTQAVFEEIENAIREAPEQWFWYNKRWILDPLQ